MLGVPACSFFVPFDDYPGVAPPSGDASTPEATAVDGATSDPILDAEPDPVDASDDAGDTDGGRSCRDTETDPMNCGACGRVCPNGGACANGRCPLEPVTLAPSDVKAFSLAKVRNTASDMYVYFTADGNVHRFNVSVPAAVESAKVGTPLSGPLSVRIAGTWGIVGVSDGIAWFRDTTFADTAPRLLALGAGIGPMISDGANAFWGEPGGVSWRPINNALPDAGTISTIAGAPAVAFAVASPSRLLWAVDDGRTYETSLDTPGKQGQRLVEAGVSGTSCLAATSKRIVVCNRSQGVSVYDWDQMGVATTFRARATIAGAEAIALDGDFMYVLTYRTSGKADLRRMAADGHEGSRTLVLAANIAAPRSLAILGDYVYFADGAAILRTGR